MKIVRRGRWLLLTFALACAAAPGSAPAEVAADPARASDAFFASGTVVRLAIELDKRDLESLRREPRKYVKATLKEGDKVVYKAVGVHLKGAAGSFRGVDDKPGLTVNMNKFGGRQTFHGMDKWHLANSVQDPSYLSELICGELYRAAGVPAARVSHAVVTLNGRPRGLYVLKEGYDKHFRRRYFQDPRGNLYDGGFLRDIDQPLHHRPGTADVKPHADLQALLAACREPKPAVRFKSIEKRLDTDRFITFLCLQVLTGDWDGYPMNRNNYRVYHEPKLDKLIFLPSGMDQMFGDVNGTIFPGFNGLVARAVMETPEGRQRYLKRMAEVMAKVYQPDPLVRRLDELQRRLQPELAKVDPGAGRDYPNQVKRLKDAVPARARSVQEQLKRTKK